MNSMFSDRHNLRRGAIVNSAISDTTSKRQEEISTLPLLVAAPFRGNARSVRGVATSVAHFCVAKQSFLFHSPCSAKSVDDVLHRRPRIENIAAAILM